MTQNAENKILVSVCIPEYNAERFIRKNLDSIINQTYPYIEIILADDASSDRTAEIMREYQQKYPGRITTIFSDENHGSGVTRNSTLALAKGDYIFFCDCDDTLKENCIEALVESAQMHNFPDIIIDGFEKTDEKGSTLYKRIYNTVDEAIYQSVPLFAKIVKRSFLEKKGIKSPECFGLEDVLWQASVFSNNPSVVVIDNCGYRYVKNMSSISHTKLRGFRKDDADRGFRYLVDVYQRLESQKQKKKMMYFIMQYTAWYLLKSGTGIGGKKTVEEYKKVKEQLEKYFPQYKSIDYVSLNSPKGSRFVVRCAIMSVALLMKFHLAIPFFYLYGTFNFTRLWPDL